MTRDEKSKQDIFDENLYYTVNSMFNDKDDTFPEESKIAFVKSIKKGWLTRQYFSKGRHDLVLPAWVLGILGPDGEGRHGIAGSPTLINSDLRSYIALGSPDSEEEPVIDHRGGVLPLPESYTLIFGTLINDRPMYSSEIGEVKIELLEGGLPIATVYWKLEDGDTMVFDAFADRDEDGNESLVLSVVRGFSDHQIFVTICPLDQDGITQVETIEYDHKSQILTIDDLPPIKISEAPIRTLALPIIKGHAGRQIVNSSLTSNKAKCKAKAASWAATFPVRANPTFIIDLSKEPSGEFIEIDIDDVEEKWEDVMDHIPVIKTSNEKVDQLFKNSAVVLRLLADINKCTITVGPSVQEELWIPAMAFEITALERLGFNQEIIRAILGNVHGNIDINGLAVQNKQYDCQGLLVYALGNHYYMSNDLNWLGEKFSGIKRVIDWIIRQRRRKEVEGVELIQGLLPKGNALWFDPTYWKNDYYYSHNFWAAGALDIAMNLALHLGRHGEVEKYRNELEKLKQDLDDSISSVYKGDYLPSGPLQRDNAEIIFNLFAFYPLKLYLPEFQPLVHSVEWLLDNYVHQGGLLIDQPWNAYGTYLSILLAQACRYLRKDEDTFRIINFMINNTTNDEGWAEGISPLSKRGSVGDSPNGYTAAEWINLILDLFVEQYKDNPPIFLKGMPLEWLSKGVSAKGLNLNMNSTIDISAKLEGNEFSLDWDYQTTTELLPQLALPRPLKDIPTDIEQLSSLDIVLPSQKGSIKLILESN